MCSGAAAEAAKIAGVWKVLTAEDALYGHRLAEPVSLLLVGPAVDYDHIVASAATDAKNILPRVAALLDVVILSDVTGVARTDGKALSFPARAPCRVAGRKEEVQRQAGLDFPPECHN